MLIEGNNLSIYGTVYTKLIIHVFVCVKEMLQLLIFAAGEIGILGERIS